MWQFILTANMSLSSFKNLRNKGVFPSLQTRVSCDTDTGVSKRRARLRKLEWPVAVAHTHCQGHASRHYHWLINLSTDSVLNITSPVLQRPLKFAGHIFINKAQNSQVLLKFVLYEIPLVQWVIAFILTASLQILMSPDNEATFSITCKALFKYPGVHISGIRLYTALNPFINSTFPVIKTHFTVSVSISES